MGSRGSFFFFIALNGEGWTNEQVAFCACELLLKGDTRG